MALFLKSHIIVLVACCALCWWSCVNNLDTKLQNRTGQTGKGNLSPFYFCGKCRKRFIKSLKQYFVYENKTVRFWTNKKAFHGKECTGSFPV